MIQQERCKEKEDSNDLDQYISENCGICGEGLIRLEDIWTDLDSGNYCCEDCAKYHKLNTVKCKEMEIN